MVSIVIPVYKVSDFIERCIRSVIAQSYNDIECVLVDDASPDDSIEKVERLLDLWGNSFRFKVIRHEHNKGLSAARNTGTIASSGEFVYYLDSDDEISPDCIEKLVSKAKEHPEADIVIGNNKRIENKNNKTEVGYGIDSSVPTIIKGNDNIVEYFYQKKISCGAWNRLIRRSFIEDHKLFFKEGIIAEDTLWTFYLLKYLRVVAVEKEVTYYYYLRPKGITLGSEDGIKGSSFRIIYDEILHNLTPGRESDELKRYVDGFCYAYVRNRTTIPGYNDLYTLYWNLAKKYSCIYAIMILRIMGLIGYWGNTQKALRILNSIRWKVKKGLSRDS